MNVRKITSSSKSIGSLERYFWCTSPPSMNTSGENPSSESSLAERNAVQHHCIERAHIRGICGHMQGHLAFQGLGFRL